jgi:hypothetical protein
MTAPVNPNINTTYYFDGLAWRWNGTSFYIVGIDYTGASNLNGGSAPDAEAAYDATALLAKTELTSIDGDEYMTVYDPDTSQFHRIKPGTISQVPSTITDRLSLLESQVAANNVVGGLIYENHSTAFGPITNSTTETHLVRVPADSGIANVSGDQHILWVMGLIYNNTGVSANLSFRIRINNVQIHQFSLIPIAASTEARLFTYQYLMTVGATTVTHSQYSILDINDPITGASVVPTVGYAGGSAVNQSFVSTSGFPKKVGNLSAGSDITSTFKNTDLRVQWGTADANLQVHHMNSSYTIQKAS